MLRKLLKHTLKYILTKDLYRRIYPYCRYILDIYGNFILKPRLKHKFYAQYDIHSYEPRIGIHAVFIAKENILFLDEWIRYHKNIGVEYFFLYDNSKVEVMKESFITAGAHLNKTTKRGIPYDYIVQMSDEEIQEELERIQREIPNVYVIPWRPKDENGLIYFAQDICQSLAAKKHQDLVDWMAFIDMDEYIVPQYSLKQLCINMVSNGYIGCAFYEQAMDNRYKHLDKNVCEINYQCTRHLSTAKYWPSGKVLCYLPWTVTVTNHTFRPYAPRQNFAKDVIYYRHYKCNHHIDVMKKIIPLDFQASRSIDWKLKRVVPNWQVLLNKIEDKRNYNEIQSVIESLN